LSAYAPQTSSFLYFLTLRQNQRKVYHEVLIAGDLTQEDVARAAAKVWSLYPDSRKVFDTTEFVYDNDTVYFAQPSLSQFVHGGSGVGTFNPPVPIVEKDPSNDTLALMGGNALKSDNGAVIR